MITIFYSHNIEAQMLPSNDANFKVSSPFNKSTVIEEISQKLSEFKYRLDLDSVKFVIKDNQLYAEGLAYEEQPPTDFSFDFLPS